MIGLKKGKVILAPYNKEWAACFKNEKILLQEALGSLAFDIQHVGSTSVPGMPAKPIVDIAVGIKTIKGFRECIAPLEDSGYVVGDSASNSLQFFLSKGRDDKTTYHLHLVKYNGELWKNYLAFRDYLRANRKHARKYAELKETLFKKYPENRKKYTAGKAKFVRATIKTARILSLSTL
jgi:GrpB-like predicted nucleotidyltransferase (UPF0157 family)